MSNTILRATTRVAPTILLLVTVAYAEKKHSQSAIKAFNAAVEHFNAGDCAGALPFLDQAISADSDFAEAFYARGACRYRMQSPDGALMDLSDSIRLDSTLLDARAMRGVIHYDADRWDAAMDDFNYVLTRKPTDAQALVGRGVIYLGREQKAEAETDFRVFLKAHPSDPLAPKLRGLLAKLRTGEDSEVPEEPIAQGQATAPKKTSARRKTATAPAPDMKALAESLMSRHALSDKAGKQILRGNRGPVAGDLGDAKGQ